MKKYIYILLGLIIYWPVSYLTQLVLGTYFDIDNAWIIWGVTMPAALVLISIVFFIAYLWKKHRKKAKEKAKEKAKAMEAAKALAEETKNKQEF